MKLAVWGSRRAATLNLSGRLAPDGERAERTHLEAELHRLLLGLEAQGQVEQVLARGPGYERYTNWSLLYKEERQPISIRPRLSLLAERRGVVA